MTNTKALLALADGSLFHGRAIGALGRRTGEVVFNTSISGYQEIITDPSYCQQLVTLTYPHVGNVGTNVQDEESQKVHASGLIVRDCPPTPSNWRSSATLPEFLAQRDVVAIAGIDTRALTRLLRDGGAQSGCLVASDSVIDADQAIAEARAFGGLAGADLAKEVTTDSLYQWGEGSWQAQTNTFAAVAANRFRVVAYDFGVKRNILRLLAERDCRLTVVPAQTSAEEVLAMAPDGIFLSNGPGDPEPCEYAIASIQEFLARRIPLFGICLGHQLLALASGARTVKMKFGHHGANHPVQSVADGRVLITSQNHGFSVDEASLPTTLIATHHSLFDGSLQGIQRTDRPAFGFQGHPEASPGPHDAASLFDHFIAMMTDNRASVSG